MSANHVSLANKSILPSFHSTEMEEKTNVNIYIYIYLKNLEVCAIACIFMVKKWLDLL